MFLGLHDFVSSCLQGLLYGPPNPGRRLSGQIVTNRVHAVVDVLSGSQIRRYEQLIVVLRTGGICQGLPNSVVDIREGFAVEGMDVL